MLGKKEFLLFKVSELKGFSDKISMNLPKLLSYTEIFFIVLHKLLSSISNEGPVSISNTSPSRKTISEWFFEDKPCFILFSFSMLLNVGSVKHRSGL